MDRSSLRRVETTNDVEKRLAFKAKLTEKISKELKTESAVQETFNGMVPGDKVSYPSLGVGTIVSIDKKNNELVIEFNGNNISLVLSQASGYATKFVGVVVEKDNWTSATFGDVIDRTPLNRPDTAYRQFNVDEERPVVKESIIPSLPVGIGVWHPELGACKVVSVNTSKNEVVLSTNYGERSLVLSTTASKLRVIEDAPESVPLAMVKNENKKTASKVTPRALSVILPPIFKSWGLAQQFDYLTRNQHLTTEETNDVFAVLKGETPAFSPVKITWEEPSTIYEPFEVETQAPVKKEAHPLVSKRVWHPDFGACIVASVEGNEIILESHVGHVPFLTDRILPHLVPLKDGDTAEVAPKAFRSNQPAIVSPVKEETKLSINLPDSFMSLRPVEQYQFLQVSRRLVPEDANDIVSLVSGGITRSPESKFEIIWTEDFEAETKPGFAEDLFYKKPVEKKLDPASLVSKKVWHPDFGECSVNSATKNEIVLSTPVGLIPFVLDAVINSIVVLEEGTVLANPEPKTGIVTEHSVQKLIVAESRIVDIELPEDYANWSNQSKYIFLTKTKKLRSEDANDVLSITDGKDQYQRNVVFNISWEE